MEPFNTRKPVALAEKMPGTNGAFTMAVFKESNVPVGTELYAQLSVNRANLEVEVANSNALHWQENLRESQELNSTLRRKKLLAHKFIRDLVASGILTSPQWIAEANRVLELE